VILYFSGQENLGRPETVLGAGANLMLTYADFHHRHKPDKRFREVLRSRRKDRAHQGRPRHTTANP
jgi:hypothetical protein